MTWPVRDDRGGAAGLITPSDVDFSSQDDGEAQTNLTDRRERFARLIRADLAKAPHPLDLGWLQNRKHLLTSCLDDGLGRRTDHLCAPASGFSSGRTIFLAALHSGGHSFTFVVFRGACVKLRHGRAR